MVREYIGWDDWNKPPHRMMSRDSLFKHYYGERDFDNELPGKRLAQFVNRNWPTTLNYKTAKEFIDETISTFGHSIFELIERRDKWEEWKRERSIDTIPIDKEVWNDIKGNMTVLNQRSAVFPSDIYYAFKYLKGAVKKADPSWCDKD